MKNITKKLKGKKVLSMLLALIMVLAICSPAFSPIIAKAASEYPVELGFNNLFIFEEWASDENSTSVVFGGKKDVGTLTPDINNGSFTLMKTSTATDVPQVYNGHGESKTDSIKNTDYYSIDVEPSTTYCFSYNLDRSTGASVDPYLFMFDSDFLCKVTYKAPGASQGANSFLFTTPSDVEHIQFRFTLTSARTAEAVFSNISLTKCDVTLASSTNLFDFNTWGNSKSGKTFGISGAVFADGTVKPNTDDKSILMNVNAKGDEESSLFTGFSLDTIEDYYTIPAAANTSYVLNYNLINTLNTDYQKVTPYIVTKGSSGIAYIEGCSASGYGKNAFIFTTAADTTDISVVFAANNSNTVAAWQVTVKDIELLKTAEVDNNKITPNRLVKTYGKDATYGNLPTPTNIPANHIFAGWNTKADGTGMRITADTPVQPVSYTVYPVFQPAVDSLTVATQPTKTVYTIGEKLDTTGLVLSATISGDTNGNGEIDSDETNDTTFNVSSGYYCTPEVLNTAGTQTITAHYGGKTATFTVTVKASDPGTVIVNGVSKDVTIANKEYTFNLSTSAFNRYEVTYKSDSYVSGVATFNDEKTEEFFLEPSENGSFSSYVDKFLEYNTYNQIVKIKFTTLDKENGEFELISLNTAKVADPGYTVYCESPNGKYEMGISLLNGGVVSELYDLSGVYARVYNENGKDITKVDYKDKLDSGHKAESTKVNLINTLDRGRYLQQSYYGTGDKPYVQSEYNNADWPYNPVQGGNVIGEPSKIIDYKVTDEYVYIKARPLDWAKWSDEYAATDDRYEAVWGDDYITDTYVEAWYYFQGDTIKVTNRKVDYSGLPEASNSQEFPALYLIEPLNHFVYNNVSAQDAWTKTIDQLYSADNYHFIDYTDDNRATHWNAEKPEGKLINYEEPEYWGLTEMYKEKFGMQNFEPFVNVNENWAAFTASEDRDSFGVGIYTDATTKFYYGVQPTMYQQKAGSTEGSVGEVLDTPEYRHAQTIDPSPELPTSYIAPTDTAIFRSYEPTEYTYYLTTGKVANIRDTFQEIHEDKAKNEAGKPKIAVPETVYLDPANNKLGQYYATNVLNPNNYYSIETKAEYTDMYLGVYAKNDHTHISVNVENVDDPTNDVDVCASGDTAASYDGVVFKFTDDTDPNEGTFIFPDGLDMDFDSTAAGLNPGEKATVKWTITTYAADPATNPNCEKEVFTAYTVVYAPHRTVGAVSEGRQIDVSQNEISSWITGANSVDHSQRAPLKGFHGDKSASGYFNEDPLAYNNPPKGGTGESADDYIVTKIGEETIAEYSENAYVLQTATNGHDGSMAQSYLGLLTVDKSRYTNTNQIPNLKIGFDALRNGTWEKDSFDTYKAYYTLGTSDSFTSTDFNATPSGWTEFINEKEYADSHTIPDRKTIVPEYKVSEIDGKYIHAFNQGRCLQPTVAARYSNAGTSVLCSVTDKEALRETVTDAYGVKNPTNEFLNILKDAATILGDPSATQADIDLSQKELGEALSQIVDTLYALKYDNLFSIYEFSQYPNNMKVTNTGTATYKDKTLTVVNGTITGGEAYTNYGPGNDFYKVDLKPNTDYVFEYDVTSDVKSQAFMFFYNSENANSEAPTNMSVQTNGGAWTSKTERNSWWGNYAEAGTYHFVIKFTTGATTTQAGFRFGNTSNDPTTSTFSNIKLIDAERYYADVDYPKTEDVYKEYMSYGVLPFLTRPGYTFNGWVEEVVNTKGEIEEVAVTSANVATKHKNIFSKWTIENYTITYDANGGSVSPTSQNYTVETTLNIPKPTRDGYTFQGWTATTAEGNWELGGICSPGDVPAGRYGNVTLTAQWTVSNVTVLFDTILDFSEWNIETASDATISNVTDNGFTLTSNEGAGEGCSTSPYFTVTPGKQYYIDIDIEDSWEQEAWDVYIFFYDEYTNSGLGLEFTDGGNRFAANGAANATRTFTAPEKAVKAVIRLDANNSSHSVTFSDIRVYEVGTCASDVNVPDSNINATYGEAIGALPVPTRPGYDFLGWYDANGDKVTETTLVTYTQTTTLKSKWKIADTALVADSIVVDFGDVPVAIEPLKNDTIFNEAGDGEAVVGFSADENASYTNTLTLDCGELSFENNVVTFTPTSIINSATTVYYHASATVDGEPVTLKNQLTIAPASNVYYEETKMADSTKKGDVEWSVVSDQDTVNSVLPSSDDIYGWDNAYNNTSDYSNGTALYAELNSTKGMSYTKTFKFTGTALDIVSACGRTTGIIVVNIKNSDGKRVKGYIVDTYYAEGAFGGKDLITQVPVVNWTGAHGTYTVEVAAMYLSSAGAVKETIKSSLKNNLIDTGLVMNSGKPVDNDAAAKMLKDAGLEEFIAEDMEFIWFDDNSVLNGGTGVEPTKNGSRGADPGTAILHNYIDGFRVYNPLGRDADTSGIYSGTEQYASYANVINHLATLEGDATNLNGIAYITGALGENDTLSYAQYQSIGPKGELYLVGGSKVSFKIKVAPNERIMLGLRAVDEAVTNVKIGSVDVNDSTKSASYAIEAINSRTEMYYDITNCLPESVKTGGGEVTITIDNTNDVDMLAINHIKFSGAKESVTGGMTPRSVSRSGDTATEIVANRFLPMTQNDLDEIQAVLAGESNPAVVKNGVVTPIVEEEEEIPGGDNNEGELPEDPDNGDGSDSTENIFDIFSLLKGLIEFIRKVLFTTVGNEHLF